MPTTKIGTIPKQERCSHPDHNPPAYMVYTEGEWEHVCPACGRKVYFTVYDRYEWKGGHRLDATARNDAQPTWRGTLQCTQPTPYLPIKNLPIPSGGVAPSSAGAFMTGVLLGTLLD